MLLADELLLLCLDEESGRVVTPPGAPELSPTVLARALAEALLVDLRARDVIAVDGSGVVVSGEVSPDDGLLTAAREASLGVTPAQAVAALVREPMHAAVGMRLVDRGILRQAPGDAEAFPEATPDTEDEVRRRLLAVLDGADPRPADIALLALLDHVSLLGVLDPDAPAADLQRRARTLTEPWHRSAGLTGEQPATVPAIVLPAADGSSVTVDARDLADADADADQPRKRRATWDGAADGIALMAEAPGAVSAVGDVLALGGAAVRAGAGAVRGLFNGLDFLDLLP